MTPQDSAEPFGYFKPDPFGWTDCDKSDEGAVALYERPQPTQDPDAQAQITRLIAAEHALSDAYVRVRQIIGATNPPNVTDHLALWAYVESVARDLANKAKSAAALDLMVSSLRHRLASLTAQATKDAEAVKSLASEREANAILTAELAALTEPTKREPCTWTQVDDEHTPDTWQGACGAVWSFIEGGPADNGQRFCPKCGSECKEVRGEA